jgi:hypothetical protein
MVFRTIMAGVVLMVIGVVVLGAYVAGHADGPDCPMDRHC